jgi:LytS/YehU family sensor histidine kinase
MLASPYFTSLLIATLVAAASTLLVLWDTWVQSKANEQERHLQKVAAELSVLKLQISPHFLFNTLNNIRWLVRSGSAHAEPAIVKLSQLLRYILYQASQEKVSLSKEVEHLQDYVALQKMRLPEGLTLDLSVQGDLNGLKIVPLLLIPLVENFFKHGDFTTSSTSKIELTVTGDKLTFLTVNKILRSQEKEPGESGIGIGNVRKRLALHYPSLHELTCHEAGDEYYVKLNIILSN